MKNQKIETGIEVGVDEVANGTHAKLDKKRIGRPILAAVTFLSLYGVSVFASPPPAVAQVDNNDDIVISAQATVRDNMETKATKKPVIPAKFLSPIGKFLVIPVISQQGQTKNRPNLCTYC